MSVGRNDPCPCGSGKKYKKCCLGTGGPGGRRKAMVGSVVGIAVLAAAVAAGLALGKEAAWLVVVVGLAGLGAYLLFSSPPPPGGRGDPGAIRFGS